jgi:Tfp pilus assembly protein PilP
MTSLRIALVIAAIGVAAPVGAQAPTASEPAAKAPAPAAKPDLPAPPPNFTYSPEGRRDPFVNLGRSGTAASVPLGTARPAGSAGLLVDELSVRGIVQSQGAYVAMVSGPAGQTFTVRAGSKLFDGTVRSITPQTVVIMQQVTDPLSLQKQREVRKSLRVQEEGK